MAGSSGGGVRVDVGGITIQAGGGADPEAIGREVELALGRIIREAEETSA